MKILVSAAKTGGHIFPAISVGEELETIGHEVIFVGSGASIEVDSIRNTNFKYFAIPMEGFRGKSILNKVKSVMASIFNIFRLIKIIKVEKIDAMIGFGGFITVPAGIACWILRKPVFTHEQNSVLGSANKLLSRFSKINFIAFPLNKNVKNSIVVGNPIRSVFKNEPNKRREDEKTRIYITGGSQGADYINKNIPASLKEVRNKILVKHQCGAGKQGNIQSLYEEFGIQAEVKDFYDNPNELIEWCDFVISRSGALTISEVSSMSRGLLMIPLPTAIDNHQFYNAKYIENIRMGIMHQEQEGAEILKKKITDIVLQKTYNIWKSNQNKDHLNSASSIVKQVNNYLH
jgi:UDP-N-acetylglucosamine--N-acetylmuramyl-(pentapeptide) pyrophosphoryl-undecaprenol N-acetylglucosamine transferase